MLVIHLQHRGRTPCFRLTNYPKECDLYVKIYKVGVLSIWSKYVSYALISGGRFLGQLKANLNLPSSQMFQAHNFSAEMLMSAFSLRIISLSTCFQLHRNGDSSILQLLFGKPVVVCCISFVVLWCPQHLSGIQLEVNSV